MSMNESNDGATLRGSGTVRRLSYYAICCVAINLAICWLYEWKLSGLAIGANVAAFAITALLLDRYLRSGGFDRLRRRVEASFPTVDLAHIARAWLLSPIVPLALIGFALQWGRPLQANSLDDTARVIDYGVHLIGMFWIFWWCVRQALNMSIEPIDAAKGLVERLLALWVASLLVRVIGSQLSGFIDDTLQHPTEALAWLVAYGIIRCASLFTSSLGSGRQDGYPAIATGQVRIEGDRLPRSDRDIQRCAAHEAGHALMFAQRRHLPDRLSVSVKADWAASDLSRGAVTYRAGPPELRTEAELKWLMLTFLAGSEAERLLLGDCCEGAFEDNEKWTDAATVFLGAGFGEVFYPNPADNGDKLQHNRMILNSLRDACREEVFDFLRANRRVLEELTQELVRCGTLHSEQLVPFFDRVNGRPLGVAAATSLAVDA